MSVVCCAASGARRVERGQVLAKPGTVTPHTKFKAEAYILTKEEGRPAHAVFHQLPSAIFLPDDRCHRLCNLARGHGNGDAR